MREDPHGDVDAEGEVERRPLSVQRRGTTFCFLGPAPPFPSFNLLRESESGCILFFSL